MPHAINKSLQQPIAYSVVVYNHTWEGTCREFAPASVLRKMHPEWFSCKPDCDPGNRVVSPRFVCQVGCGGTQV